MPFVEINVNDLDFFERLGEGAAGTVYRGRWASKEKIVAIKKLNIVEDEAEVLNSLSHRNIIQFFGAVTVTPHLCIVTEYAEEGSLYGYLRKHEIDFHQILLWAKQIGLGMNYLHCEAPVPVIHRDLKSKNVVIAADLTAKICDFGSSKFHAHTTKLSLVGTFPWMSPEVIQQLPCTTASDVYSYSVVLWELLTHEVPFKGIEGLRVAWLVVAKGERLTIPASCPVAFANLMRRCWITEPKERPTFKQVLDALDMMLNNESLREETDTFLSQKNEWKVEIDNKLDELKAMEKDLTHKQRELDAREKILEEREMKLQQQPMGRKKRPIPAGHDVLGWSQEDVANWVYHISPELAVYSDLFSEDNITGKTLFLLTGDDLLQIGIYSIGHRKELLDEILKLKQDNFRLRNFPPLPTVRNKSPARPLSIVSKVEKLTAIIGSIYRKGVSAKDHRWKFFIDFDGSHSLCSFIKQVSFVFSHAFLPDKETMTTPPYLTSSWRKRSINNSMECVIQLEESAVARPLEIKHMYYPQLEGGCEELTLEVELLPRSRTSLVEEPDGSATSLSGVWANRASVLGNVPDQNSDLLEDADVPTPGTAMVSTQMTTPSPLTHTPSDSQIRHIPSASPHHQTPPGLSLADNGREQTAYKGQPLKGVWANKGVSGAAVLRRSLTQVPESPLEAVINLGSSLPNKFPSLMSSRFSSRSSTPVSSPPFSSRESSVERGQGSPRSQYQWNQVSGHDKRHKGTRGGRGRGRGRGGGERGRGGGGWGRNKEDYKRSISDTHGLKQEKPPRQLVTSSEPSHSFFHKH